MRIERGDRVTRRAGRKAARCLAFGTTETQTEPDGSTPQALLMAIGFGAFAALVLVHFQATLFLEITHGKVATLAQPQRGVKAVFLM